MVHASAFLALVRRRVVRLGRQPLTLPASSVPPRSKSSVGPSASCQPCWTAAWHQRASFSTAFTASKEWEFDEDEMRSRREWIVRFGDLKLQREDFSVSFARSSGPGGQNVNKLNTKAEVRLDLGQANDRPPPPGTAASSPRCWLTREVASRLAKNSPYYVTSSHSVLITSMRHRTQEANLQDALEKMHSHILEVNSEGVVGETSDEQRKRVRLLEAAEQRKKKANKVRRSDVKSGRKFKG